MSKYIDLAVLADAKVDKFGQSTLRAGDTGILVSPVMAGVSLEGGKIPPSFVISNAGTATVNGLYTPQGSDTLEVVKRSTGNYATLTWTNGSCTIYGAISGTSISWSIYSGTAEEPTGAPIYTGSVWPAAIDNVEPWPWTTPWSTVMGAQPYPQITEILSNDVAVPKVSLEVIGAGTAAVNGIYTPADNNAMWFQITDVWNKGKYSLRKELTNNGNGGQRGWVIIDTETNEIIYNTGATTLDGELRCPWSYTWQIGFTNGSSTFVAIGESPVPTILTVDRFSSAPVGLKYDATTEKWMVSDGSDWVELTAGGSAEGELISFTRADLVDGILTIHHNLGRRYLLGLDYSVTPKEVTFTDENTLVLDYSDQANTGDFSGTIWFVGSKANMLT